MQPLNKLHFSFSINNLLKPIIEMIIFNYHLHYMFTISNNTILYKDEMFYFNLTNLISCKPLIINHLNKLHDLFKYINFTTTIQVMNLRDKISTLEQNEQYKIAM